MTVSSYKMKWLSTGYREDRRIGSKTPIENMGRDSSTAQRTLFAAWGTREQATRDFLGWTGAVLIGGSGEYLYPTRQVPNYHPDFSTNPYYQLPDLKVPYLFADSIRHEGFLADKNTTKGMSTDSSGGAVSNFSESMMTVNYSSTPYVILTDDQLTTAAGVDPSSDAGFAGTQDESTCLRYVWGKLVSSPKYQTLPAIDTLSWAIDNKPITTTAVVILCEGDLLLKWYNIPLQLYDRQLTESVIGKTNDADFGHRLSPLGVYPKGTLVFVSPDVEPFRRATGEQYLDITYRFKYYPRGANKFYYTGAPNTGATVVGGGSEIAGGPGFYLATRPYNGRAVTEAGLAALPPGVNVLLFPYGNYSNLFRARFDQDDASLLDS